MRAPFAAVLTLALFPPLPHALAKAPKDGPAAPPSVLRARAVVGGWLLEPSVAQDRTQLGTPARDDAGARFLTALVRWDESRSRVERSAAVVVATGGQVERVLDLGAQLPLDWRLSGDGASAAVVVQDLLSPDAPTATLLVFPLGKDAGAGPRRVAVGLDARLAAGRRTFAIAGAPAWVPDEELDELDGTDLGGQGAASGPVALAERLRPAEPLSFVRANGDRVPPRTRLTGEVAPTPDGGFVAFGGGRLVRVDESLEKTWEVEVGFEGALAASTDGSLIVVADQSPGVVARRVLAFDAGGRKRAEVTVRAPLAVELAVAPDGAGFLATSAPLVSPALAKFDGLPGTLLVCFGADGSLRWQHERARDVPSRSFTHLALSKGAAVAAAGWIADVEDSVPELLVFGKDGKVVYRTDGPFDALALDADGASLWTLEGSLLSRLAVKTLAAGTATRPR